MPCTNSRNTSIEKFINTASSQLVPISYFLIFLPRPHALSSGTNILYWKAPKHEILQSLGTTYPPPPPHPSRQMFPKSYKELLHSRCLYKQNIIAKLIFSAKFSTITSAKFSTITSAKFSTITPSFRKLPGVLIS